MCIVPHAGTSVLCVSSSGRVAGIRQAGREVCVMFPTLELEVSLCFLHQSVSCSWDKAGDREVCIMFPTLELEVSCVFLAVVV